MVVDNTESTQECEILVLEVATCEHIQLALSMKPSSYVHVLWINVIYIPNLVLLLQAQDKRLPLTYDASIFNWNILFGRLSKQSTKIKSVSYTNIKIKLCVYKMNILYYSLLMKDICVRHSCYAKFINIIKHGVMYLSYFVVHFLYNLY